MAGLGMSQILDTVRKRFLSIPDFRKTSNKSRIPSVEFFHVWIGDIYAEIFRLYCNLMLSVNAQQLETI